MHNSGPFKAQQLRKSIMQCGTLAVLATILILAGCASSDEMIRTSNNQMEYRITCGDNPFSHREDCHDRAAELCTGLGYTILKEDEIGRGQMMSTWSTTTHELIIKCG